MAAQLSSEIRHRFCETLPAHKRRQEPARFAAPPPACFPAISPSFQHRAHFAIKRPFL
jgi:hypothetical protein